MGAGEPGRDLYFGQMLVVGPRPGLGRNWSGAGVHTTGGAMADPARSPGRTPPAPWHG